MIQGSIMEISWWLRPILERVIIKRHYCEEVNSKLILELQIEIGSDNSKWKNALFL